MRMLLKLSYVLSLCLYVMILSKLILFKYMTIGDLKGFTFQFNEYDWNSHNFIPFKTIINYVFFTDVNYRTRIDNVMGNIVGFIPFGLILPLISQSFQSYKKIVLVTFSVSLTFEILQLIFRLGSFDVDDLLLNSLGGVLGYALLKGFQSVIKSSR
ncbi:VanZ family protein [Bacillus timonensis]|nr:VanZ family protein [Bacillus timonensis]